MALLSGLFLFCNAVSFSHCSRGLRLRANNHPRYGETARCSSSQQPEAARSPGLSAFISEQVPQQLPHSQSSDRIDQLRRDLGQRAQDEKALAKAWMRNVQAG